MVPLLLCEVELVDSAAHLNSATEVEVFGDSLPGWRADELEPTCALRNEQVTDNDYWAMVHEDLMRANVAQMDEHFMDSVYSSEVSFISAFLVGMCSLASIYIHQP